MSQLLLEFCRKIIKKKKKAEFPFFYGKAQTREKHAY